LNPSLDVENSLKSLFGSKLVRFGMEMGERERECSGEWKERERERAGRKERKERKEKKKGKEKKKENEKKMTCKI
jgi:hypothetical protein